MGDNFSQNIFSKNLSNQHTAISNFLSFFHAATGYPFKSTQIKTITNNHYITWHGITQTHVLRNLGKDIPTIKGHTIQGRNDLKSAKVKSEEESVLDQQPSTIKIVDNNFSPDTDGTSIRTNYIYPTIIEISKNISIDLIGCFPIASNQGNKYVFIL